MPNSRSRSRRGHPPRPCWRCRRPWSRSSALASPVDAAPATASTGVVGLIVPASRRPPLSPSPYTQGARRAHQGKHQSFGRSGMDPPAPPAGTSHRAQQQSVGPDDLAGACHGGGLLRARHGHVGRRTGQSACTDGRCVGRGSVGRPVGERLRSCTELGGARSRLQGRRSRLARKRSALAVGSFPGFGAVPLERLTSDSGDALEVPVTVRQRQSLQLGRGSHHGGTAVADRRSAGRRPPTARLAGRPRRTTSAENLHAHPGPMPDSESAFPHEPGRFRNHPGSLPRVEGGVSR